MIYMEFIDIMEYMEIVDKIYGNKGYNVLYGLFNNRVMGYKFEVN